MLAKNGSLEPTVSGDQGYADLSRDKKPHKKQIVTGFNLSKEGIPLAHNILPGRSSDKKEALNNIQVLQKSLRPKKLLLGGIELFLPKRISWPSRSKMTITWAPLPLRRKILSFLSLMKSSSPLITAPARASRGYRKTLYIF